MNQSPPRAASKSGAAGAAADLVGATVRSLAIGCVCVCIVCVLVTVAELICGTIYIGDLQLPPAAIGLLLGAIAISKAAGKLLGKRFSLSSAELAVIYIMCVMAAMVSSHGLVQKWLPLLVVPEYFASRSNAWHTLYGHYIKQWMVPYRIDGPIHQLVSTAFYEGLPHGASVPWLAWLVPLTTWGLFWACFIVAFLCLASILRRQWVDNEKLSFPLAQLPYEILEGRDNAGRTFFVQPLVWCGAGIPVVVYSVNWLHQFVPSVASIPISISINDYLLPPYNVISLTTLQFSYAAVGFFFLLPSDILFSLWFFFLLTRLQQLVALQFNIDQSVMPLYGMPVFVGYQSVGAYLVLVGYLFAVARPHLKQVWLEARGKKTRIGSTGAELMPYSTAFWGLAISLLAACLLLTAMGMSFWLSVLELFGYLFIIGLVMARSTAEAGLIMTSTSFRPVDLYRLIGSPHDLGGANLTVMAFVDNILMRDQRGVLLTGMLDSSKLGSGLGLQGTAVLRSLVCGIVVALCVAVPLQLCLPYLYGGLKMEDWMMVGSPSATFHDYQPYFHAVPPIGGGWQPPVFFGVGVVVTLILVVLRSLFYWWPLHPLGYALAGCWSTIVFWFPCLVAWVLKSSVVRYGGIGLYQQVRPFFLGLILGEFGMAVLSAMAYVAFRVPPPGFPWG